MQPASKAIFRAKEWENIFERSQSFSSKIKLEILEVLYEEGFYDAIFPEGINVDQTGVRTKLILKDLWMII